MSRPHLGWGSRHTHDAHPQTRAGVSLKSQEQSPLDPCPLQAASDWPVPTPRELSLAAHFWVTLLWHVGLRPPRGQGPLAGGAWALGPSPPQACPLWGLEEPQALGGIESGPRLARVEWMSVLMVHGHLWAAYLGRGHLETPALCHPGLGARGQVGSGRQHVG